METTVIKENGKIILRKYLGNGIVIDEVIYEDLDFHLDDYFE